MALSPNQVWEVRTTGNDANGGAFRAGATGTDYSQQDAAQVSFTDLAIGAATEQLTSSASPFTSAHVGNVIKITSGTGFTAGRYEILSVSGGVATMDRSVGAASSTGGVGKLGGCLATIGELGAAMVGSNLAWIKSGSYGTTSTTNISAASVTPSPTTPPTTVAGYNATRGDITPWSSNQNTRPRIQTNSYAINGLTAVNGGVHFRNLIVENGSSSLSTGITVQADSRVVNCKVAGYLVRGIIASVRSLVHQCEVTGGAGTAAAAIYASNTLTVLSCYLHDNVGAGVYMANTAGVVVDGCVITNHSGAGGDGIYLQGMSQVRRCTLHGNARDGIRIAQTSYGMTNILGNILSENGGYGINVAVGAGTAAAPTWDGNAFYANTLGARNNLDDTSFNPTNGVAPYSNVRDVILTASPFTDKATGDWTLNNTAGGGRACRGTGVPSNWPGMAAIGYPDFGAIMQQRSSNEIIIPFMGF